MQRCRLAQCTLFARIWHERIASAPDSLSPSAVNHVVPRSASTFRLNIPHRPPRVLLTVGASIAVMSYVTTLSGFGICLILPGEMPYESYSLSTLETPHA